MSAAPAVRAARFVSRPQSPYVGLAPYDEDDAAFFFGRSQEVAIASANLRSARLTILYGPSGVGKSSLLQAGVVHGLREKSRSEADESPFAICTVRSWLDDPIRTLQEASRAGLQELAGNEPLASPRATLTDSLHAWTEQAGTLLVVLDQFEEYFQYHAEEGAGEYLVGFAAELARVVNDPNLAVNVLLSIREDAWAKLDRFEGHIPLLFANYLRVDHLDLDAAREAIEAPIAAWNRTLEPGAEPYDIEPALIGAVLSAAGGGLTLAAADETAATAGDRVEAPFLQLVLERLWRATVADGAHVLTLARLQALGGARQIVERHLLDALGRLTPTEQDAASDCFRFLVSSSKAKIAHPAADLAEWTRRSEPQVTTVLDKLCSGESGRILRAVAPPPGESSSGSYELFHDVLAEPILAWRRVHERERSRRAAHRRLVRVGSAALALVAVLTALSVWALIERVHANHSFHAQQVQTRIANGLLAEQRVINTALETSKGNLTRQNTKLIKQNKKLTNNTDAQNVHVAQLRQTNRRLQTETTRLRSVRTDLDRAITSLRTHNRQLSDRIAHVKAQNRTLAAKATTLDDAYVELARQLRTQGRDHELLVKGAATLHAETAALDAQLASLRTENRTLSQTAGELTPPRYTPPTQGKPKQQKRVTHEKPAFNGGGFGAVSGAGGAAGILANVARTDVLRHQIEDLQRQRAQLLERRARLAREGAWLRNDNKLLEQQRDALRKENAQLETKRAALTARNVELRRTLEAVRAKHDRLSSRVAVRERRNRDRSHAVAAQRKANKGLQARNNGGIDTIDALRSRIAAVSRSNRDLVDFIAPRVNKLLQAAQDPSQDPGLAGLLAVKGYRLTPYDPDDPAHPGVYNALWFALSRLDAKAARDLIAPDQKASGKIGTTHSALIMQKICGLVTRGLTQEEWNRFMPSGVTFTTKASQPCS
jgi:predicted nuclease with TOPRIM domain